MKRSFFNKINYSSANEDGASERAALRGSLEGQIALAITGSGSRPLELLISKPERVIAIDVNPSQNFLLELKMAAMRILPYPEFVSFIGITPCDSRIKIYQDLRSLISPQAGAFWDSHLGPIQRGVLYCGRWEKYLRRMSLLLRIFRPAKSRRLMFSENLECQRVFWKGAWDDQFWNTMLKIVGHRKLWEYVAREPGAEWIPSGASASQIMAHRLGRASRHIHFRKSAFAWLFFTGKYNAAESLPCSLSPEYYQVIKEGLPAVKIVTQSLSEYLQNTKEKFAAFSLSDFGSYASPEQYCQTWQAVTRASSQAGARVVEREFLVPRVPEEICGVKLERDRATEEKLALSDRSMVYDFVVGTTAP
jgi:S-adenosylmethionine-diacylglycerol 3-amino-3-carboxypropyl transferase